MKKPYNIIDNDIRIFFSSRKEDNNSAEYMNTNNFIYLSYFKRHFKKNSRHVLYIKIPNDTEKKIFEGLIMWFLNRDMYNTLINDAIYKQISEPKILKGYLLAEKMFASKDIKRWSDKTLKNVPQYYFK